jgi:hypothetical protein
MSRIERRMPPHRRFAPEQADRWPLRPTLDHHLQLCEILISELGGDKIHMPFADIRAYSKPYKTITHIGHARPTPSFGAPTLIWQLGIWPKRVADPQDTYGLP